jgi:hypothetical protein
MERLSGLGRWSDSDALQILDVQTMQTMQSMVGRLCGFSGI